MVENYKVVESHSEREIRAFLQKKNIKFLQEYRFKELTNEAGKMLPVDFVINLNNKLAIIEYNGQHHVNRRLHRQGQTEDKAELKFNRRIMNDLARKKFSKETKIPLLTISHRDGNQKLEVIKKFIQDLHTRCSDFKLYGKDSSGHFYSRNSIPKYSAADVFEKNDFELTAFKEVQPTNENQLVKRLAYSSDQILDLKNELKDVKRSHEAIKNERDRWRENFLELRNKVDKLEKELERNKSENRQPEQPKSVSQFETSIGELVPELQTLQIGEQFEKKSSKLKLGGLLRKIFAKK